jgi:hypothetical protein
MHLFLNIIGHMVVCWEDSILLSSCDVTDETELVSVA